MIPKVTVGIPPPPAAGALPDDPAGLSTVHRPADPALCFSVLADPLLTMMDATGRKAQAAGLTETDVDAELDGWNAERRS